MKIAVLFDGAGLARLGLEKAGHSCTGFEINPIAHHLSCMVGSGNCILADVLNVNLKEFNAVWASPPCQLCSTARTQGFPESKYSKNLLDWSLSLPHDVLWVENVTFNAYGNIMKPGWGKVYNAAQFQNFPIQNRNRMIGGRYSEPKVKHLWKKIFPGICPCITATEYKGCASDQRRASRYYGRRLTLDEVAYHQGFNIPKKWYVPLSNYSLQGPQSSWSKELYRAIGNGVPVYMAYAFGKAVT